jgi:hypothetical protein
VKVAAASAFFFRVHGWVQNILVANEFSGKIGRTRKMRRILQQHSYEILFAFLQA